MNNSFGPIPADVFRELAAAPYGKAKQIIRRYDPLWGFPEGEALIWKVRLERERSYTEVAYIEVEAATEDEAMELADKIEVKQSEWDSDGSSYGGDDTGTAVSAKPVRIAP